RNAVLAQCLRDGRAVAEKHWARRQNERLPAGIVHGAKCAGVAALAFDLDHARLQPQLAGRLGRSIALLARNRVECDSDGGRARKRLARDLDAFGGELELADENTGHVPPGTREIRDISLRQRVEIDGQKRDRPAVRSRQCGTQRALVPDRQEHVDLARRELAIVLFVALDIGCLDVLEREVAAFLIAQLGHPLEEIRIEQGFAGLNAAKAATQQRRLLRARRKRPRGRRAKKRDELAAPHSIASSARAGNVAGTSRPSACAVLRLTTNSNLVGCWTGRSPGLSPLRMRST